MLLKYVLSAVTLAISLASTAIAQPQAPASAAQLGAGETVSKIQARGALVCGVGASVEGFSVPNAQGQWHGMDVDICRAIAAAVLGDSSKVRYVPVTSLTRFPSLQSGEIDVLLYAVTWTFARDAGLGIDFPAIYFMDGQSFLVKKSARVKSIRDLNGATVCTNPGSASELNLADYFRKNNITYKPLLIERSEEVAAAYLAGRCDAWTSDRILLETARAKRFPNPNDHELLPEIISKEPYSPVVRHGDNRWADIVRWSVYVMIEAEELGITSATIDAAKTSTNPAFQRMAGTTGDFGKLLGLRPSWSYDIIKQVGNYNEVYARNLGPLDIQRGPNRLWRDGGLLYSPAFR